MAPDPVSPSVPSSPAHDPASRDAAHDPAAVIETVYGYAWGVDRRDWTGYRAIFDERVRIDFSSWNGQPPTELAADEWVGHVVPLFTGLDASQHSMTNPRVVIDGPTATCLMYVTAEHVLCERWFTVGGWYDDRLVWTGDGWKLSAVTLHITWRRGDFDVMADARRLGESRLAGGHPAAPAAPDGGDR